MKMFKMLLAVMLLAVTVSFAAGINTLSPASTQKPVIATSLTGNTVSLTYGTTTQILYGNANVAGGYVLNVSTAYIELSSVITSTTTMDAGYFLLYPSGDTYQRDRLYLNQWPIVYQGALIGVAKEGASGSSSAMCGVGKATTYQLK